MPLLREMETVLPSSLEPGLLSVMSLGHQSLSNGQCWEQATTAVLHTIHIHMKMRVSKSFIFIQYILCISNGWTVFSSVAQSHPTLCDPMNRSTPGLPVHHQLPEFTQTHVHWVSDAIQPSHSVVPFSSCPQSFPASGSFPMSQLFAWGGQSIVVSASASVLPVNTQDWSPLGWTGWISLQSKGLSRVFSNTTVQKHQFFCDQLSL